MQTPLAQETRGRVLLLEPNAALRSAITTIMHAERYKVDQVASFDEVLHAQGTPERTVALVAWQGMQGLLAEQQRAALADITRRTRLVVMVPRQWSRLLQGTDLTRSVTALIAKPFQADELLETLEAAFASELETAPDSVIR